MNNKYKLFCFINVFDVWPAFLLPVFYDGNRYYFEKIQYNTIEKFVDADLTKFSESTNITINENKVYLSKDEALYAIGFEPNDYIYGNITKIINDYQSHPNKYEKDKEFRKSFFNFLNNTRPIYPNSEEKRITSTISVEKRLALRNNPPDFHFINYIAHYKSFDYFKHSNKSFENNEFLLCVNNIAIKKTDDIYLYKQYIDKRCFENNLLYKKRSRYLFEYLPFEKQISIINFVMKSQPQNVLKRTRYDEIRLRNISTLPKYLWNKDSLYCIISRMIESNNHAIRYRHKYRQYYNYLNYLLNLFLKEWNLIIDKSLFNFLDNGFSEETIDEYFEGIEEEAKQESSLLYFFDIKKISVMTETFLLVVQNYYNEKQQFYKINSGNVCTNDLMNFFDLLYKETNNKITIIINKEDFFCDEKMEIWLEDNQEKINIKSLPSEIGINA